MTFLSINHYWRILAAGISYTVFGIGVFIPAVYMLVLAVLPMDPQRKQRKVRKSIRVLCRFYVDFMQFVGLMNYYVQQPNQGLAESTSEELQGTLVISNHSMLIDALFILAYVDNLCCVVKQALTVNPFTRLVVSMAGYISNSADDFVTQAAQKLADGENVLVFPEGTRNTYDTQLEFKRGAANIAVMSQCPVLPMVVLPRPRALQRGERWYQLPDVKSTIHVHIHAPLMLSDCVDTGNPRTLQYRRLTEFWREYYLSKIAEID